MGSHAAVAALGLDDDALVTAVLQNWRTAPVNERLRGMLGFLEKVTLTPSEVTPQDVVALHSAGVNDRAIEEALYRMEKGAYGICRDCGDPEFFL